MMMFLPTAIFDFYSTHVWQDIKDYSFPSGDGRGAREVEGAGWGCDRRWGRQELEPGLVLLPLRSAASEI